MKHLFIVATLFASSPAFAADMTAMLVGSADIFDTVDAMIAMIDDGRCTLTDVTRSSVERSSFTTYYSATALLSCEDLQPKQDASQNQPLRMPLILMGEAPSNRIAEERLRALASGKHPVKSLLSSTASGSRSPVSFRFNVTLGNRPMTLASGI